MRLVGLATVLVLLLGIAQALDPFPPGLAGTYFADAAWTSTPVRTQIDALPSTDRVFAAWRGAPPDTLSVTWRGSLVTLRSGRYTFATTSDDGSWVYVDGTLVVENPGHHEARTATGTVPLGAGVHSIFVKYFQDGGALSFDLSWARDGSSLTTVPSWAMTTGNPGFGRSIASVVVRRAFIASIWLWYAAVAFVLAVAIGRDVRSAQVGPAAGLLWAGAAILFFVLPHEIQGDARARFLALSQLLEWHEVPITAYSMVGPLLSVPLYVVGKVYQSPEWWCARFNTVVFIAGLWAIDRLMRERIDDAARIRFLLVLVACSMFPYHLEGYYAEALTAILVAVGLVAVDGGFTAAGWSAAVVGVVNSPATLAGLAAAAAKRAWDTRRVRHAIPVVVAAAAILLESWIRRGSPFVSGYEGNHGDTTVLTYSGRPGFSYPLLFGVLSILLSFGKGLVFYAPGLLLPIEKPRSFHTLWLAFLAGIILIYAKWWAWFGGLFWGPRFFAFASIPASFAIAVWLARARTLTLPRQAALLLALTLSFWVAVDGALFGYSGLGACRDPNYEWLCLYVPEFSALWRPFVEWTRPTADRIAVGAYFAAVYAWLAAPLIGALTASGRSAVHRFLLSRSTRERWRF